MIEQKKIKGGKRTKQADRQVTTKANFSNSALIVSKWIIRLVCGAQETFILISREYSNEISLPCV